MINIVSRSEIFSNVTGPKKVIDNLKKGLDGLGYPYVINKALDSCEKLYIHDDRDALRKIATLNPKIKVVVGPNLYDGPRNLPSDLDLSRAVYLTPSPWFKNFWVKFGFNKCPIEAWPAGIDTNEFKPSEDRKEFVLVYFKQREKWELERVEKELRKEKISYQIIHYDTGYREADFKNLLKKARYMIWIGRQETQGIALEEVLSSNIPILVCDVSCVGHCSDGGEYNEEERKFNEASSAPYFDERCGIMIKDLNAVGPAIQKMELSSASFRPREYILENLSLEKQARELLGFYEKYFNLSYEEGFNKKLLRRGKWKNDMFYYQLYLKAKYVLKMFFVKVGVWRFLRYESGILSK